MTVVRPTFADICFQNAADCDNPADFCSNKGNFLTCATRSDRCGEFHSLAALFDIKCPTIVCTCSSVANPCLADGSPVAVQCTAPVRPSESPSTTSPQPATPTSAAPSTTPHPCTLPVDEVDPNCSSAFASIADDDWNRFRLILVGGVKSEVSIQLCDTFRTIRVCFARYFAADSSCPRALDEVTGRASRSIGVTIPLCDDELVARSEAIDCNLCSELPSYTFFMASAASKLVADVLALLIASVTFFQFI